ncbi:MAG: hypothetical protein IJS93_03390 [Clostridia bacterium]|nr:hypothetical protein [Clostridia bacterium]
MNAVEKARDFIRLNLFFIVIFAACAVYVARGLVDIVETGKTIPSIIADGAVAAAFGFFISKLMSLQGLAKGENNEFYLQTVKLHAEAVDKITDRLYLLDAWCDEKNRENLASEQRKILFLGGVSYEDFIKGEYTILTPEGEKKVLEQDLPKEKKKAVKKARKLRLTPITASSLTSDGGKPEDKYYLGKDKRAFERLRDGKQITSKLACGVLFGYYGVNLITDFDVADLIWTGVQVAIFLIMGLISYLQGYFFIVDEYRHRIIKKIDNVQKFDVQTKSKSI